MDQCDFINSPDIREHIRNVGHQFTSTESAWLVWQCDRITISQRHEAWRELIRTMPDEKIGKRIWTREWPSLHGYLEQRMSYEERLVDSFLQPQKGAFYTCEIRCPRLQDKRGWQEEYDDCFSECSKCHEFIRKIYGDDFSQRGADRIRIRICKRWIDSDVEMTAEFNWKQEITAVWQYRGKNVVEDVCAELDDFEGMWFDFPTPFRKGDIVEPYESYDDDEFVLDSVITEDRERVERRKDDWDNSDMTASGYYQDDDGTIFHEVDHNYMDLQFHRGELTGKKRVLRALSSFLKGEIDIDLYSNAYLAILMEEKFEEIASGLNSTDGFLRSIGLK